MADYMAEQPANDPEEREARPRLASTTTRNLMMVAGNAVERTRRQDACTPFSLRSCMEDAAEHHFGDIKRLAAVTTCKTAVLATHRKHLMQWRKGEVEKDEQSTFLPDQSTRSVSDIAGQALRAALLHGARKEFSWEPCGAHLHGIRPLFMPKLYWVPQEKAKPLLGINSFPNNKAGHDQIEAYMQDFTLAARVGWVKPLGQSDRKIEGCATLSQV